MFAPFGRVLEYADIRHLGGGRKGLFLLLRYVFIVAASYLLLFQVPGRLPLPTVAAMIATALASNVAFSFVPAQHILSWYLGAPVLVADTLWVSWALYSTGAAGQEFFLLYSFVLFLAMLGESLPIILLGSGFLCAASFIFVSPAAMWTSGHLLRVVFLYVGALFYGHVLGQLRRERARADRGFAWARELEAKVAERTEELQRLYEECLAANRLKSEFIASMSHELRTPLHIMLGYTEMLLDGDPRRTSAERDQMVVRVRADAAKLSIVPDNLVNNAIKFTRNGTITVSASDLLGAGRVVFRVEDTGPGIPREHLAAIFEPFHQVDGRSNGAGGVGLGLAIVRGYATLLGGDIRVFSEPGVGTSFEVTLPYRPGEPPSDTRPAGERREQRQAA